MFRAPTPPGVWLLTAAIVGILSLLGRKKKRPSQAVSAKGGASRRASSTPQAQQSYVSTMERIAREHSDFTAEVFNIIVSGRKKVEVSSQLAPGDRVDLRQKEGTVKVYAKGTRLADAILLDDDSRIPSVLADGISFDAYLGGRDVSAGTDTIDFLSIVVFYKIDGVPPTKLDIN